MYRELQEVLGRQRQEMVLVLDLVGPEVGMRWQRETERGEKTEEETEEERDNNPTEREERDRDETETEMKETDDHHDDLETEDSVSLSSERDQTASLSSLHPKALLSVLYQYGIILRQESIQTPFSLSLNRTRDLDSLHLENVYPKTHKMRYSEEAMLLHVLIPPSLRNQILQSSLSFDYSHEEERDKERASERETDREKDTEERETEQEHTSAEENLAVERENEPCRIKTERTKMRRDRPGWFVLSPHSSLYHRLRDHGYISPLSDLAATNSTSSFPLSDFATIDTETETQIQTQRGKDSAISSFSLSSLLCDLRTQYLSGHHDSLASIDLIRRERKEEAEDWVSLGRGRHRAWERLRQRENEYNRQQIMRSNRPDG